MVLDVGVGKIESWRVELRDTPRNITTLKSALKFCQDRARQCYSSLSPSEIRAESYNSGLISHLVKSGHHSVFDAFNLNVNFFGIPKIGAMIFNNEPPYSTSEKSARYTQMSGIEPRQKEIYDSWIEILAPAIEQEGVLVGSKNRKLRAKKLAQENARYMTSAFTPTNMDYTFSLRHLNEIRDKFERFMIGNLESEDVVTQRIIDEVMLPYLTSEVIQRFSVPEICHKGKDTVNLFGEPAEEVFVRDYFATNKSMSIACLAQAQRHRTLTYQITDGLQIGGSSEIEEGKFFVPPIVKHIGKVDEWLKDMSEVAEYDLPQGQLLKVSERGMAKDFDTMADERICGPAQLEIMVRTAETARKINRKIGNSVLEIPPCVKKRCEKGGCPTGKNSLDRII